nr:MAG TPA: hypothetical protein [Microviridae sp.]
MGLVPFPSLIIPKTAMRRLIRFLLIFSVLNSDDIF